MITLAFFAVVLLGASGGIMGGLTTTQEILEWQSVRARSQIYLNRVMALNFGEPTDVAPSAPQLDELFDDDTDLGTATLVALSHAPPEDGGWMFQRDDFPVDGEWLVSVTRDINDDGLVEGDLEEGGKLVRIAVSFNGRRVLSTIRGKETQT
jgi:hypothetical protein